MDQSIVVAVCTKDRPNMLHRLLTCLARQDWPPGSRLLIVDNSPTASARALADDMRDGFAVDVGYIHEPRPGYATPRNRALAEAQGASGLCFIDDDAVVARDWLSELTQAHQDEPSAAFHSTYSLVRGLPSDDSGYDAFLQSLTPGHSVRVRGASGLLLPLASLRGLTFDDALDEVGGEDTDLLMRLRAKGIPIRDCPALAAEEDRRQAWPLARVMAMGRASGRQYLGLSRKHETGVTALRTRSFLELPVAMAAATMHLLAGRRYRGMIWVHISARRIGLLEGPR